MSSDNENEYLKKFNFENLKTFLNKNGDKYNNIALQFDHTNNSKDMSIN
jgi:hypothetical protein